MNNITYTSIINKRKLTIKFNTQIFKARAFLQTLLYLHFEIKETNLHLLLQEERFDSHHLCNLPRSL